VPGADGELTILPEHAPLMTALKPGPVVMRRGGEEIDLALSGGFMEVRDDKIILLADTAERSDEIDAARAEEARERAREQLANRDSAVDFARALAALERAQARLRVTERRRRRPGGGGAPRPTAPQ
jgi:F-type H+-transporting ATPase subunit epsilon